MANVLTDFPSRTTTAKFSFARLVSFFLSLDAAYQQRAALQLMPQHRLDDIGVRARDVAPTWNPPVMFLY